MAITVTLSGSVGADVGIFEVYYNSACFSGSDGGPITGSTVGVARLFSGSETSPYDFEYSIDFPDDAYEAYVRTLGASGSNGISGSVYCSQCFGPVALPGVDPPAPPPPPVNPEYSLTSNKSQVNEGDSFTITLTTANVAQGTDLDYTVTGITSDDLSAGSITGTFTVDANGEATQTFTAIADSTTEGDETFTISLDNGAASTSVTINDTSLTPSQKPALNTVYLFANWNGSQWVGRTNSNDYCTGNYSVSVTFKTNGNPSALTEGNRIFDSGGNATNFSNTSWFAFGDSQFVTNGDPLEVLQVQNDGTISQIDEICTGTGGTQ